MISGQDKLYKHAVVKLSKDIYKENLEMKVTTLDPLPLIMIVNF